VSGQAILDYLGIGVRALQGVGGLLLVLVALELFTGEQDDPETSAAGNVAMVPLGTPVAGAAILRLLKDSGILLVTRIAGLLLAAIAVQLVADAVRALVEGG